MARGSGKLTVQRNARDEREQGSKRGCADTRCRSACESKTETTRVWALTSVMLDCAANTFPDEGSRRQFECPHPDDPEPPDPFPLDGREVLEQVFAESEFGREEARADDGRHGEGDEVERDEAAAGAQGAAESFGPGRCAHIELRSGPGLELLRGSCEAGGGTCAEEGRDVADRLGEQGSRSRSFRAHLFVYARLGTGRVRVRARETSEGERFMTSSRLFTRNCASARAQPHTLQSDVAKHSAAVIDRQARRLPSSTPTRTFSQLHSRTCAASCAPRLGMLHARFLSTSVDCLLSAGNSVKPLDRTSLVHIPPLSMRVNQKLVEDVQAAFDEATTAYKTQVGDGAAWSEFYDCLTEILDRSTGLLGMGKAPNCRAKKLSISN